MPISPPSFVISDQFYPPTHISHIHFTIMNIKLWWWSFNSYHTSLLQYHTSQPLLSWFCFVHYGHVYIILWYLICLIFIYTIMMHSNLSNSCFYESYILYSFMMKLVSYMCHFKLIYQPQIFFVKSYLLILSLLLSCMILLFKPNVLSLLFVKKIVKINKCFISCKKFLVPSNTVASDTHSHDNPTNNSQNV